MADECGAPEFYTHGAKLAGLPGVGAKVDPDALDRYLSALPRHVKQMPPRALTLKVPGLGYTNWAAGTTWCTAPASSTTCTTPSPGCATWPARPGGGRRRPRRRPGGPVRPQ